MGKHIILDTDLHRITLDDGEWVDVLEKVPKSVRDIATRDAMRTTTSYQQGEVQGSQKVDIDLNMTAFSRALRIHMIKAWSFKFDDGSAIPVTPEYIDKLDESTADLVGLAINRLNTGRSKTEKKG